MLFILLFILLFFYFFFTFFCYYFFFLLRLKQVLRLTKAYFRIFNFALDFYIFSVFTLMHFLQRCFFYRIALVSYMRCFFFKRNKMFPFTFIISFYILFCFASLVSFDSFDSLASLASLFRRFRWFR